jgi:hypothetical protein
VNAKVVGGGKLKLTAPEGFEYGYMTDIRTDGEKGVPGILQLIRGFVSERWLGVVDEFKAKKGR